MNLNLTLPHASVTIEGDRVKIEAPATPELREQLKPKGRWKPTRRGEKYWLTNDQGMACWSTWADCETDRYRYSVGNVHKTAEDAANYRRRQVLRQKLYDLRDEFGGVVSDGDGIMWVPQFDQSAWKCSHLYVASEFAFHLLSGCRDFVTKAAPLLTEYFKQEVKA